MIQGCGQAQGAVDSLSPQLLEPGHSHHARGGQHGRRDAGDEDGDGEPPM